MTAFDTVLSDIFEQGAEARLDREEERRQIAAAQVGDEKATIALLYAYAPVLRAWSARYTSRLGAEEARSLAIAGLLEAIHAFNLREHSGQLAGIVWQHVSNSLRESGTIVSVPEWTRRTYLTILRTAGDDHLAAERLAPSMGMTVETFRAVREALAASHLDETHGHSIDRATPVWVADRDAVRQDVRDLALEALAAVDGEARDVVRYAYGFVTGDPMSDEEVRKAISTRDLGEDAVAAGETTMSRAKVQRIRKGAIVTMKNSLESVA